MKKSKKNRQNKEMSRRQKYIIAALISLFLILPWILADLIYKDVISFPAAQSVLIGVARWFGFSYSVALDVLSRNLGVLVSVVSLFMSLSNIIADRLEKKIFGISRKRISQEGMPNGFENISRAMKMIACSSPLVMIVCIIKEWCVTGYGLLLYCYVFLIINYLHHNKTYSNKFNTKQVTSIVLRSMEESLESVDAYLSHQALLNDFGRSVREDSEWANAEKIYFEMTDRLINGENDDLCIACADFFKKGFVDASKENTLYLLRKFICRLDENSCKGNIISEDSDEATKNKERKGYLILWVMLCEWMDSVEEVELLKFLQWFMNFGRRSSEQIERIGVKIEQSLLNRQCVMVYVLLERWIELYTPTKHLTIEYIKGMNKYGKIALAIGDEFWETAWSIYSGMKLTEYKTFGDFWECKDTLQKALFHPEINTMTGYFDSI